MVGIHRFVNGKGTFNNPTFLGPFGWWCRTQEWRVWVLSGSRALLLFLGRVQQHHRKGPRGPHELLSFLFFLDCCSYVLPILPTAAEVCLPRCCLRYFFRASPRGRFPPGSGKRQRSPSLHYLTPGRVNSHKETIPSPGVRHRRLRYI